MDCKKEEAKKAMDIAEKKLSKNDYDGAKTFISKAQALYPKLDGLEQVVMMIDVYISASNKINGEADWYGILGIDPLADEEAVKKQYKKLALLLHPDKNRFNGAEGAFKLVRHARDLLSDQPCLIYNVQGQTQTQKSQNHTRTRTCVAYDHKRKPKQVKRKRSRTQDPPKPHKYKYKYEFRKRNRMHKPHEYAYECDSDSSESDPEPDSSWKQKKPRKQEEDITFWTVCKNNKCNTHCKLGKAEVIPEMKYGRPVYSFNAKFQPTSKSTSDASSSSTTSTSDTANEAQDRESSQEEFVPANASPAARGDANEA
ncbi:DnaJ domain [Arabidopsis suecica]|uniref:DnaJ domain n=1 Tax=Arabidopsis suecica TaxID=45249 RepID=A0A8T2EAS0_ARASU|nr:DnaJ domain [Arabidopsis suecica]